MQYDRFSPAEIAFWAAENPAPLTKRMSLHHVQISRMRFSGGFKLNWIAIYVSHQWITSGKIARGMMFGVTPFYIGRHVHFFVLRYVSHSSTQGAEKRFPYVFRLAMDVLPAQASAVPCERIFSSSKETCTPRRNRIDPKLMEALQILKFSFRSGAPDFAKHVEDTLYYLDD